jgi:putative ABC transport system ATP-binding protein
MLEVRHVTRIYGEGAAAVTALDDVSLTLATGGFMAVTGHSGSGKSTLLNIIGGLESLTRGEILLDGERLDLQDEKALVAVRRQKIAYVFQQYHLLPSLTAIENVLLPVVFHGSDHLQERGRELLRRVGLEKRVNHRPGQLSGGEQQRVAIARALVTAPALILADEPTGNMDKKTGDEIMTLFDELNREGHTIIMVTHNPEIAAHAQESIVLQDGRIISHAVGVDRR